MRGARGDYREAIEHDGDARRGQRVRYKDIL